MEITFTPDFVTRKPMMFKDAFSGQLETYGIVSTRGRFLVKGSDRVHVNKELDHVLGFSGDVKLGIQDSIGTTFCEALHVDLLSQSDPEYYGFSTTEQIDDLKKDLHARLEYESSHEDEHYKDLLDDSRPLHISGFIGRWEHTIAKSKTHFDHDLLLPENKHRLLMEVTQEMKSSLSNIRSLLRFARGCCADEKIQWNKA